MKKIINIFVKNLQLNLSIQPNSRLILTNSSGQDSIILCAFFFILQKQWQIEPILLYCNHLWQYDSIPITYHTGGVSYCLTSNYIYSTTVYPVRGEANARTWRYNVFERVTILTMSSSLVLMWFTTGNIKAIMWTGGAMLFCAIWGWRYPGSLEEHERRKQLGLRVAWLK